MATATRPTSPDRGPADAAPAEPRWSRALRRPSLLGVVLAAWFVGQSMAPSLLARTWFFQGVLTGISLALGYAVGLGLTRLLAWIRVRFDWPWHPFDPARDRQVRVAVVALSVAYATWAAFDALAAHRWTWERLGYERSSYWLVFGGTLLLAAVVALALFAVGRLLTLLWRLTTRVGTWLLPAWIAAGLALVLVGWVVLASLNNLVLQRTLDGFNAAFALGDRDLGGAPERPTSRLRSGGPDSEVQWDEAGREGRRFLTRGPTTADLEELATGEVVEPVRVFVGRASADTVEERVDLAMEEMERFGGFEREALLVVIPTGTGWINEQLVQPLEYFHDGDVATVTVQYSHLPSPLAFLSESAAAGDTAVALVEAVEARLAALGDDRPRLFVAGESLGSFGGSQVFDSLADSRERVDGAVWVGPPETMRLRREAERVREPGSRQVAPVVGDGESYVFANRAADLEGRTAHTVFLQHGDDPIVWWDWDTLADEPDWLEEPLDPAVNPAIEWTPVTTFLQLAVDMAVSNDFDEDHGHKYGTQPLDAWYAVVRPPGWDRARVDQLRERLAPIDR
ncbi:alpha/beta-hydrolase family protein [Nocardioides sp. S-58]|uniref:Alpha/beta-hydrolase family protein n=1 Tax=Nocardioides renjunii TaxID=3095075 RepID=A0ABU5KAN8_9ACTN|nr:alpha/beta-hydrolase family protein [Nocardioides sp. S-58]MDZ5662038.1 alpha/beta-hydrolase family protein [Nocardioides sp. S-58]